MALIMTPDHPDFGVILHSSLPPGWIEQISSDFTGTFGVRAETGLLEPIEASELDDYIYGGEYDCVGLIDDD